MTDIEMEALVKKHVTELSEHFDSVRIFITIPSENDSQITRAYNSGAGNFYAQLGQIREWLSMQDEYNRAEARRRDAQDHEE